MDNRVNQWFVASWMWPELESKLLYVHCPFPFVSAQRKSCLYFWMPKPHEVSLRSSIVRLQEAVKYNVHCHKRKKSQSRGRTTIVFHWGEGGRSLLPTLYCFSIVRYFYGLCSDATHPHRHAHTNTHTHTISWHFLYECIQSQLNKLKRAGHAPKKWTSSHMPT